MMPILDGSELVKKMRDETKNQFIPIILLSARAGEEQKAEGVNLCADDYLTKPFSGELSNYTVVDHQKTDLKSRNERDFCIFRCKFL
jgi:DNA-binding response OmpR family regulator